MVNTKVTPLFNYIGGKSWLKEYLKEDIIKVIKNAKNCSIVLDTYVEPFAGGLGAFLGVYDILHQHEIKNVILNDVNSKLINFYQIVKNEPMLLIKKYMALENKYSKTIPKLALELHKTNDKIELKKLLLEAELFFKKVRSNFNKKTDSMTSAVNLLFLQSHCFNGIYRENSKGEYNTPFNWEPRVVTKEKISEKILAVTDVFTQFNVVFKNCSFANLDYNKNSLYYLDPPYINELASQENQYHGDGFGLIEQKLLIEKIKDTAFIYSNHSNPILIKEFKKHSMKIHVQKIARKNIISASADSRKNDKIEILIRSK
jgi:DNA adenine methylase Dam